MSNRTTLDELIGMKLQEVSSLPLIHLAMLFEDVAALETAAKEHKGRLEDAMALRFADKAAAERKAKNKDTGSVTIKEDGFSITCDLPKAVAWDEAGLAMVENTLNGMGEPAGEYVKVKRTVSESAYNNWPSSLKTMFLPFRTVGTGKPTYKFAKKGAE